MPSRGLTVVGTTVAMLLATSGAALASPVAGSGVAASSARQAGAHVPAKVASPVAHVSAPGKATVHRSVTFDLHRTTTPKGDRVTGWSINYGDHSKVTPHRGGVPRKVTHTYIKTGQYTVKLTVTDLHHRMSTAVTRIAIEPVTAPVAVIPPTKTLSPTGSPSL